MSDVQEVEITLEQPSLDLQQPATETVVETDGDKAISELQRQYNELKQQDETRQRALDAARLSERDALARAHSATQETEQTKVQIAHTELSAVESGIAAAKAEADAAARSYQSALEAGDFAKATEEQRKLARAEASTFALEREKDSLATRRPPATEGRVQQPIQQQQQPADPFERALVGVAPKSQEWLRKHPECVTDGEARAKVSWAHEAALKRFPVESDDYFKFVEQQMGYADQSRQTTTQPRPQVMPSAPPSRTAESTPGVTKTKVKLSSKQVENATDGTIVWNHGKEKGKPIGVQEMARRIALIEANGGKVPN